LTHINVAPARPFEIQAGAFVRRGRRLPEIVALELGDYLVRGPDGELLVSHMFIDDIRAAERRGDLAHAAHLKKTLRHFIEEHLAQRRAAPDR
jgi:hypothetical protein